MMKMAKIQLGHQLYIYQLIAKEYGTGHQIFLPKIEELFKAEGIEPEDLGFETYRDVMAACSDFVTLTDFKGGRSYVTIVQNEQWDEALAAPVQEKGSGKAGKPWKKKKGSQLKAVKPRHIQKKQKKAKPEETQKPQDKAKAPEADAQAVPETPSAETQPEAAEPTAQAAPEAKPETVAAEEEEPKADETPAVEDAGHPHVFTLDEIRALPDEPEAEEEPASKEAAPETPAEAEPEPEPAAAAPAPEPKAADVPVQEAPQAPVPVAPAKKTPAPAKEGPEASVLPRSLPRSFSAEVHCKDELLSLLTRMLPFDIDLTQILDEDWHHALATGAVEGSRSRVSFPIRFLAEDGTSPIRLTIRRSTRPIAGKQWSLILVDGDDGTGHAHDAVGIEGLPHVDEGAWSDLLSQGAADSAKSPDRAFSDFASFGSWESVLGTLARMAAPEVWSDSGAGSERYPILHEYLVSTFVRLSHEGKILEVPGAGFAAFNTGLVTAFQEDIYACLTAATAQDPSPWQLAGFAVAGAGELGQKLVALMNPLPQPTRYLTSLADIEPDTTRLVSIDYHGILLGETERLPKAWLAAQVEGTPAAVLVDELFAAGSAPGTRMQAKTKLGHALAQDPSVWRRLCRDLDEALQASLVHARTSYRWCAPAYEPSSDSLRLLLPLALSDGRTVDTALSLELMPSGSYQASSVVTLDRARACMRVISSEQPSWLRV